MSGRIDVVSDERVRLTASLRGKTLSAEGPLEAVDDVASQLANKMAPLLLENDPAALRAAEKRAHEAERRAAAVPTRKERLVVAETTTVTVPRADTKPEPKVEPPAEIVKPEVTPPPPAPPEVARPEPKPEPSKPESWSPPRVDSPHAARRDERSAGAAAAAQRRRVRARARGGARDHRRGDGLSRRRRDRDAGAVRVFAPADAAQRGADGRGHLARRPSPPTKATAPPLAPWSWCASRRSTTCPAPASAAGSRSWSCATAARHASRRRSRRRCRAAPGGDPCVAAPAPDPVYNAVTLSLEALVPELAGRPADVR